MEKQENFHLVYKKLGETPLQALENWRLNNPDYKKLPITYAGRLDPMAEGLLLLLTGEETKNKEKYTGLSKTYEVEVLWGVETDTLDLLGLVVESLKQPCEAEQWSYDRHKVCKVEELENKMNQSVGKFEQKYPMYSSKTVDGKPLWEWAREGGSDKVVVPTREVELFSVKYLGRRSTAGGDLLAEIENRIELVSGDFRQEEIVGKWKEFLGHRVNDEFVIDKLELSVSSGFYVRQFVQNLAKNLNISATTFHIKRTKVGDFILANIPK